MPIISYLTTIRFEPGAIDALPDDLAALGLRRPLLVTDRGVLAAGLGERVAERLPEGLATPTFSDVPANPTEEAVAAGLAAYREAKCDGVVALGGGSPMDLAKAVALMATHEGSLDSFALIHGGAARITAAVAPVVAIPTTAGTGSEVGRGALISLAHGRKLALVSPHLIPRRAVCDPDLTLGLPPLLTAATGMDALAHGIETVCSNLVNPPAEAMGLEAVRLGWAAIERAVDNGQDRGARHDMMMAAMMGALAFQKGLGAVHALSHALGALRQPSLHHGMLNAILLPHVLRYNAEASARGIARLRAAMALPAGLEVAEAVAALVRRLGLPERLSALGVDRALYPRLAEHALEDHCTATNARPPTAADYLALLEQAH